MLSKWAMLLPLCIVRRLARDRCEVVQIGNKYYFTVAPDLLIWDTRWGGYASEALTDD